ncbi:MAG: hypothetical protein KAW17_04470 [Candidatus Eisenbacteria sp.]|nr:hypothetical protein [Candidatus Eisenbacteria bacterium]
MSRTGFFGQVVVVTLLGFLVAAAPVAAQLIVDGDFEGIKAGKYLRRDDKGQDWYESRLDTKEGRGLLKLSTRKIGGNRTHKAIIKAHPELNTYLTQRFTSGQKGDFTVQFDVYIKEILPDDNRSAFFMVGSDKDGKKGPNSTGVERFVFMGFENAAEPGKINLFARESKTKWENKTIVAPNLELGEWHTIIVNIHVADQIYEVSIKGVMDEPTALDAFRAGKRVPKRLTHLSFASWNDGAGTFYVDNVSATKEVSGL